MSEAAAAFGADCRPWQPAEFGSGRAARVQPAAASPQSVRLPTADEVEQIHQEAHRAGYAAGYEEGTARARVEALQLHTLAENLGRALGELDQQVADELLALAAEIARQVVREAVATKHQVMLAVVREALAQLPHQHAAIHVNPGDLQLMRQHIGEQLTHGGHRLFEDPSVARGGCRIEAGGSQIDATIETRWRRVLEGIGKPDEWID
jgi:flagellar assembly protein FliH